MRSEMKTPTKVKVVKVYLSSLPFHIYKSEANKRNVSMSELFKIAMYEFIYRPASIVKKSDIPILRVDRTPKGSKMSKEKNNFKQVINELKSFDITTLKRVPEQEKRIVYNIFAKENA